MRQRLPLLVALVALVTAPVYAQRTTATIRGSVTDSTKAVIPGATVTVTGEDTGFTRSVTTNAAGLYSFPELPTGSYKVEATLTGFKSAIRTKVVLNVADDRAVDFELTTGAVTEQVTVVADSLAVKTIGGEVAGLVTGEQVRELPLNGRNFLQLFATLMPGVSAGDSFNAKDRGLMAGIDFSVSGSGTGGNMWTVDGANNNDVGSNHTILVFPSVDAIDEFKVHRNSYGAEFGGAAGAQVNIVTRSGTNEFHGSGYYFGRNDALLSKNYFLEQADQPKDKLSSHDFGWTFGGPIIKDKLHFFASQEFNREKRGIVRTGFVPTAAERAGDFSGPIIDGCSSPVPIDPLTGRGFPGNKIPAGRLSPAGLLVLQLYPQPNAVPRDNCNNWVDSLNTGIDWRQENARIDWTISAKTRLMLRYTQDHWTNSSPSAEENLWGDDAFPAVDSNWEQPGRSLTAQLTQNIGSNAVNTLTFTYSANVIDVARGGTNPELNSEINAAIPGIFPDSLKLYGADRGHPIFGGRGSYGETLQNMAPFKNNQNLYVLKDDYSAVWGKHFFKAGIVGSYNQKNEDVFDQGSAESSSFNDSVGLTGQGDSTGNVLADLLLRGMAFDFSEPKAERSIQQRWRDVEAYVADSWKVQPRVTLDYGVRWSRFESPYDLGDTISSFDPSTFNAALGSDACNGMLVPPGSNACQAAGLQGGTPGPNRALASTNNYFAPRVGIAWDVSGNGKMAIRAGVGRFIERESLQNGLNLGFNPPFNSIQAGSRTLDSNAEPFPGAFATNQGIPQYGLDTSGKFGYNWQWNFTVEKELMRNTTLELSYVGSKGSRLLHPYNVNEVPAASRPDYIHAGTDDAARSALRPYGIFGNENIAILDHGGSSIYHSLQSQIVSRFGHGSQFQASYTFSRTIGDVPLNGSENGLDSGTVSELENRGLDRGLTATHRKHIFNASLVLALAPLDDKSGFVKNVLGGWEVATIAQAASGAPLTVFVGDVPDLAGGPSGTGLGDNQRPNVVPGEPCRANGGPKEQWLNPNAWTITGFELGTFGNSGRGVCEGPNFVQVDLALYKNFKIGQKVKAQFRFEVFNVFNRVNFVGVNTSLNPISATLDTGDQSTATRITGFEPAGDFGQATGTRDARQAQFGIKLMF